MKHLAAAAPILALLAAASPRPAPGDDPVCRTAAGGRMPAGYLHTVGAQIVDAAGQPVRIASVGWNQGFEDPPSAMRKIAAAGFNAVRLSWVDATMQRDLTRIDGIVAAAAGHAVKVILDHHTNEAGTPADGYGAQQRNGLWYDSGPGTDGTNGAGGFGTVTQADFLAHWQHVAARYAGNSTVIGYDLDNEPLMIPGGATWGDGKVRDIRAMYQTVGNAILAIAPDVLIIAEGPQNYPGGMPWGDLSHVRDEPVRLRVPNRVVYSVHDYPAYVSAVTPDSGPNKVAAMNRSWGYLVTENIAPVWIGEMGANLDGSCCHENVADSQAWAATLVSYLNGQLQALGGPGFTGAEQGVSTDWWAWGTLTGQQLDGTLGPTGVPRPAQYAVYHQLVAWPACAIPAPG